MKFEKRLLTSDDIGRLKLPGNLLGQQAAINRESGFAVTLRPFRHDMYPTQELDFWYSGKSFNVMFEHGTSGGKFGQYQFSYHLAGCAVPNDFVIRDALQACQLIRDALSCPFSESIRVSRFYSGLLPDQFKAGIFRCIRKRLNEPATKVVFKVMTQKCFAMRQSKSKSESNVHLSSAKPRISPSYLCVHPAFRILGIGEPGKVRVKHSQVYLVLPPRSSW